VSCSARLTVMFCYKRMLQAYVSSVSDVASASDGCCIGCNGCTRMLQRSVTNISSVFFRRMLQVCLFGCCICFTHIFRVFYLDGCNGFQVFLGVFSSVLEACFKCFIYL
jgi:hypothetical protein